MNQLNLGITIALRDAFSFRAKAIESAFRNLDSRAYGAARSIRESVGNIELGFATAFRSIAAGAAVLSVLVYPTRQALAFGKALSEVATIADEANSNIAKLRDTIIDQSLRYPTSLVNQTQAAYEAVSAGFLRTVDAAYIAEEATKTAVTTMATTATTLKGTVALMNSYNMSADQAGRVSDLLFQTVRFGVVRMEELAHNIGMVSAAAATSGESIENLLGTYAGFTLGGLSPEQSAQYSRQLYLSIIKPTKQAVGEAAKYGITLNKEYFLSKGGLFGSLIDMATRSGALRRDGTLGDPASFFRMLSGRQAAAGASVLLQKRSFIANILEQMKVDEVFDDFGVKMTHREYALQQRAQSLDYQLDQLKSTVGTLAAVLGEATANVISPIARAVNAILGPVTRLVNAYPVIGKVITGQVFAWGAALMWWGAIQMQNIKRSWTFLRLLARFRREYTMLFGLRIPLSQLGWVLSGTVMQLVLGAVLIHRAWKKNVGGLADTVRHLVLVFRALTENFRTQYGVWGKMSVELNNQLKSEGILTTFKLWFAWLTRFKYFGKGFGTGMGRWFDDLGDGITSVVTALGRLVGFATGPIGTSIKGFFAGLNPKTNTIHEWRVAGERLGRLVGFLLTISLLTKTWTSTLLTARILGYALLAPFKMLKWLFWSGPKAFLRNMRDAISGIKRAALNLWGLLARVFRLLARPFRRTASPDAQGPSTALTRRTGVVLRDEGKERASRAGKRDCCGPMLRLLTRIANNTGAMRSMMARTGGHGLGGGRGGSRGGRRGRRGAVEMVHVGNGVYAPAGERNPHAVGTRPNMGWSYGRRDSTVYEGRAPEEPRAAIPARTGGPRLLGPVAQPGPRNVQRPRTLRLSHQGGVWVNPPESPTLTSGGKRSRKRGVWLRNFFSNAASAAPEESFQPRGLLSAGGPARRVGRFARLGGRMGRVGRGLGGAARGIGGAAMGVGDMMTGGAVSGIVNTVSSAAQGVSALAGAFGGLGGIIKGVGAAFKFAMGPWGIAIMAIIAVIILLWKHWDKVKVVVMRMWEKVHGFFKRAPGWVAMLFGPIGLLIKYWDKVKLVAVAVWDGIKSGIAKLKGPFDWLVDKLKAIGRAIGLIGEDPWQGVKDGVQRGDIYAQMHRSATGPTVQQGQALMERYQSYLREFVGEYQAGDFERDPAARQAKQTYMAFARRMVDDYNILRRQMHGGFSFAVEDEWINRVVREATGRASPFAVQRVGEDGGNNQVGDPESDDQQAEQTDALQDIRSNTSRSAALLDAIRRGGATRPWEGQKWPENVQDPYAEFSQSRIEALAAERTRGSRGGGQVGSKTFEQSLADWTGMVRSLQQKVEQLGNITIHPAQVKIGSRVVADIALEANQRSSREAVERGPNVTAPQPGVYPVNR